MIAFSCDSKQYCKNSGFLHIFYLKDNFPNKIIQVRMSIEKQSNGNPSASVAPDRRISLLLWNSEIYKTVHIF